MKGFVLVVAILRVAWGLKTLLLVAGDILEDVWSINI